MTLSFRQVIYLIILLAAMAFSVSLCSKQVIMPIVNQEPTPQEEVVLQQSHEERIKENISTLLKKLVGKKTFFVSVVVDFNDVVVEREAIKKTPQIVTENATESYFHQEDVLRRLVLSQRPTAEKLKTVLSRAPLGKLPGLIDDTLVTSNIKPLPGFPVLSRRELPAENKEVRYNENELPLSPTLEPHETQKFTVKKAFTDNVVFLDTETQKTTTPKTHVEKISISVIIDEDHFKFLDIDKNRLEALIRSVAALDESRGDQLVVAYVPFMEKSFDFNRFMLRNKRIFDSIKEMLYRFRWVFIGLFCFVLVCVTFFYSVRLVKYLLKRRAQRLEEERQLADAQAAQKEKQVEDEIEEKRKAILDLAKAKPEDFSNLILNWLEAAEIEDKKDE